MFSRKILLAVAAALTCSFFGQASASDQIGEIDYIQIATDGRILVGMKTSRTGKPSCATFDYWLVGDENSNAGKAQLAALLAAHAAGRQVQIYGSGTCVRWVDGENIYGVRIN